MKDYWKFRFCPEKYERGESYWLSGEVRRIQKTDDGWHAVVHGTKDYKVNIVSDGSTVQEMSCSCPNARNGGYCKHMAAVLFELTYPELTDSIPENMDHDRKVQYRVKAYEKIPARDRDVMELRDALSCLEDEYSDWDGEIDWRSGSDYAEAFLDEMKRIIEPMIEKGEYRKAFEGLKQACFVLETADLNGSLGEHSLITRKIREYWESIIPRSSPEEKEMMFEWLRGLKLHDVYSCADKDAQETLMSVFPENRYRDILLNDMCQIMKNEGIGGDMFDHYVEEYRNLLKHFGKETDICDDLLEEHRKFLKAVKAAGL
ncbi:MAG: SWIM zinc finger family protein [Solobacterium sp.]|nr:SWIM zinc finger family protein [Solobacterium sp.]